MFRWSVAAVIVLRVGSCEAADFTFSLPQLLGSPQGEQRLTVDLDGEFASISGARLSIAGSHTPGLLGGLSPSDTTTFPYPAAVDAYSPAEPFEHSGILGELLPSVAGDFEVDEAFHRVRPGGPPDFSTWLDGSANFNFSAGPSAYIAIYRTIANPVVTITSATLVVTGERSGAPSAPTADFDGDGAVDGDDLRIWLPAFGAANQMIDASPDSDQDGDADGDDFLAWQRQFGSAATISVAGAIASAVPEPTSGLLAFGLIVAATTTRRKWLTRRN